MDNSKSLEAVITELSKKIDELSKVKGKYSPVEEMNKSESKAVDMLKSMKKKDAEKDEPAPDSEDTADTEADKEETDDGE